MGKTVLALLLCALMLLGAGWFLFNFGSQLNLKAGEVDPMLWDQGPGDKWLYVGGLMMLIAGSLGVAAFRFWKGSRASVGGPRV